MACFILSGLLILKTLQNLYWLIAWDATYDPLGYIWIVVPVLICLLRWHCLIKFINQAVGVLAGVIYFVAVPG